MVEACFPWVRAHPTTHRRHIVSGTEIIQVGLSIPHLASEMQLANIRTYARQAVTERKARAGLIRCTLVRRSCPLGAQPVIMNEICLPICRVVGHNVAPVRIQLNTSSGLFSVVNRKTQTEWRWSQSQANRSLSPGFPANRELCRELCL
jgi:hypothetical protein